MTKKNSDTTVNMIFEVDGQSTAVAQKKESESETTNYGFSSRMIETVSRTIEDVSEEIAETIGSLSTKIQETAKNADEVSLEMGISMGVAGNIKVVKGDGNADIKVVMKWRNTQKDGK